VGTSRMSDLTTAAARWGKFFSMVRGGYQS
jgi:hypothetical protein